MHIGDILQCDIKDHRQSNFSLFVMHNLVFASFEFLFCMMYILDGPLRGSHNVYNNLFDSYTD